MLHLRRTLVLCLWCCSLPLHRRVVCDDEAGWGVATPSQSPAGSKSSWLWSKLPSMPSLPFTIPFYGRSQGNNKAAVRAAEGLKEAATSDSSLGSGSGDGGNSEASEPTTAEPPPTATPASPRGSDSHAHTSGSVTNTLSTDGPTSAISTRPPGGAGAAERHPPDEISASTVAPETTVPTALTGAAAPTTTPNPGLVESTSQTTAGTQEATGSAPTPPEAEAGWGPTEEQRGAKPTSMGGDSTTSTTQSRGVNVTAAGELPGDEDEEADDAASPSGGGLTTTSPSGGGLTTTSPSGGGLTTTSPSGGGLTTTSPSGGGLTTTSPSGGGLTTTSPPLGTETPRFPLYTVDWMSHLLDSATFLPDCNKEHGGICNLSDAWDSTTSSHVTPHTPNSTATNRSVDPFLMPAPPMLVPLYTDWNSAMAAWGLAWDAHVYGAGCVFAMLTLASALNLLCLPLRCPSGCGYFALVSLFLLAAGGTRSFSLLYDAYGHQDRLPSAEASLMLYEAPFPCFTAAFGLVFLLLSMRSRMQLSYSAFQRPCFLACLVVLHFAAAFGPVTLLKFYQHKPPLCLFLALISRGAFVALATFLSTAYFVFYIYVRADSKHIYHLNNTSPTPAERYNRCPFAESRDWNRAALTVCLSALFSLACAALQLYAMLNAMGVAGGEEVFQPWPWWAFQFSCRLCELGVCVTLALVVAQPVYCSDHLPDAGSCWTELLASKSPILPGSYQWTLSHQQKLAIVDSVGVGETENLPLYTLMDERLGNSLNGLDLLYHSNRALAYRDLDLDVDLQGSEKPEDGGVEDPSGGSSFTSDSTTDLRPPSPINLRRSIDEALFSDALFSMSLFSPNRPLRCSDQSMNRQCTLPGDGLPDPLSADTGLFRTSSCLEVASRTQNPPAQPQEQSVVGSVPSSSSCSSPERWRDNSSSCSLYRASLGESSLVLCPSQERRDQQLRQQGNTGREASSNHQVLADPQRHYQTLGVASQESLDLDESSEADRSVQKEFISVCRQIDALSICSETIDL